jgi:signal transduction histidine kinase
MAEPDRMSRPLTAAALALVGDGATAAELLVRFSTQSESLDDAQMASALDDLAQLGLVRVLSSHDPPRYALTSLGHQTLDATLAGDGLAVELEELERLRSDLFATVSHELRTPLTAIRTCVGLLLDPATNPDESQTRQLLETIERNADRMQRLVSDVLDLARYRTGHVHLQLRRFDARELADEVAKSVLPLTLEHGQTIDVTSPPRPMWVYGDHRRLEQALLNLVSNAGKYSPDGTVISIAVESDGTEVRWTITDQGPGIPPEDQVRLFERFFVGRSDGSGPRSGVGLGLPTALAIAQSHGGRIDVTSKPGLGSRFALCVPVQGPPDDET